MNFNFKGNAKEVIDSVIEMITGKKTGLQDDGTWVDPAYICHPVNVFDVISQSVNPNYQSGKAFAALQQSIQNTGMVFPVEIGENPLYNQKKVEEAKAAIEAWNSGEKTFVFDSIEHVISPGKEDRLIVIDGDEDVQIDIGIGKPRCYSGGQDTVDVRNPKLRSYYKYQVIDGTHRLLAILYGSPMYKDLVNRETWEKSNKLFERSFGTIPCTIIENKTEQELMSATILMNSARGDHDLMEMKDIVADLSRSGMSDQWIAKNLFLEAEAITRFKQLSGMRAAFNTEADLSEAWDPIKDQNVERRKNINLTNAARRYVRKYRSLMGYDNTSNSDEATDILMAARNLGWNEKNPGEMPKSVDSNGKVFEKELEKEEVENTVE